MKIVSLKSPQMENGAAQMVMTTIMTTTNGRLMKIKVGESLKYKNKKMKVVGFLNQENELTERYKPDFRIVLVDSTDVKWVM